MQSILVEQETSQLYRLKTFRTSDNLILLELSLDNVARVEAMIREDSNYCESGNPQSKPFASKDGTQYKGSTAYWMTRLKDALTSSINEEDDLEKIIYEAISAVDRENSTHLTADNKVSEYKDKGAGRRELTLRLLKFKNLLESLRRKDYRIIEILRAKTGKDINGKIRGRENYSFATKFCHYACYYLFYGEDEADNYSIYDNILATAVIEYAKYYRVLNEHKQYTVIDFQDYNTYSHVIDQIRENVANETGYLISRNGFDHLLWYYHKGHPIR